MSVREPVPVESLPMPAGRNYVTDFVERRPAGQIGLITESATGARREWTFGELARGAASLAGALHASGVGRGDTVLLLVGSGPECVLATLACLRLGAAAMPCSEQLRPKDLALRLAAARPALALVHERNADALAKAGPDCPVLLVGEGRDLPTGDVLPAADLAPADPAFVLFTSGTSGPPKQVTHGQRYVWGQRLQAAHWLGGRRGELVWSTAAPGWSKSARNSFIAPWFGNARALLQDRRFDPDERLATIRRERVDVLCMAPTEYRLIAAHTSVRDVPSLRRLVTAGEAPGLAVLREWQDRIGVTIADGYGQTETGHIAGVRPGETAPAGSMGRPLPGVEVRITDGELTVDPATVPTFFLGYDDIATDIVTDLAARERWWRTGDQVRQDDDGWLYFEARADDVIISSGYRIGPAEVESALSTHPSVREVAVLGEPDEARGQIVSARVVLRDGFVASDALAAELQAHARGETAPYKYPRRVTFVDVLPKTTTGKINRAALRGSAPPSAV